MNSLMDIVAHLGTLCEMNSLMDIVAHLGILQIICFS